MTRFYKLADPINNNPLRLTVTGYSDWVTTTHALSFFRGLEYPEKPVVLGRLMGGKETSIMWSDLIHIITISIKIKNLLIDNQISGWKTYPLTILNKEGVELSGYSGFSVIGKECRRDRSRSEIVIKQATPQGKPFKVYKGLYFFEEDWDGSDIFLVQNNMIVVTERVRNLFKKNKVTNVEFIPLVDVELDVYLDKFEKDI